MLHCHDLKPTDRTLVGASHKLSCDNTTHQVLKENRDVALRKGLSLFTAGSLPYSRELKGNPNRNIYRE